MQNTTMVCIRCTLGVQRLKLMALCAPQCRSMFFSVTAAAGFFLLRPLKIQYLNNASMVTGTMATNV